MSEDKALVKIPLARIEMAENSRQEYDPTEMAELMTSMRQTGLLQPIGVEHLGNEKFRMVFGFRRFLAAKKLGWKEIDAVLTSVSSADDSLIKNSIGNIQRANVSLPEQGRIFKILLKAGMTTTEIAARVGCNPQFVKHTLTAFDTIPKQYRDKIDHGVKGKASRKGKIPPAAVFAINNIRSKYSLNENQRNQLLDWATEDKTSGGKIRIVGRLMGDHAMSVKEAIAESDNIQIVSLNFAIDKKRMKRLEQKYGVKIHDVAYSWLEENKEMKIFPMRFREQKKVISHTIVRRKNQGKGEE